MESEDKDLSFVENLAAKYKKQQFTKADYYKFLLASLLLMGITLYATLNAFSTQIDNAKLRNTLSQIGQQEDTSQPKATFHQVKSMPRAYKAQETCAWPLEMPPTLMDSATCNNKQKPTFNNSSI